MGDSKRKDLFTKVETVFKTMEYDFNQIFTSKGTIATKFSEEIESLSEEDITTYGENFGDRIVEDVQNEWDKLTTLVMSRIEELLTNFNKECYMSIPEGFISINKEGVEDPNVKDIQMRDRIGKCETKCS